MILEFNQASNPEERKILTTPAEPVNDLIEFIMLMEDLTSTAKANESKCVGIASNQLWKDTEEPPPAMFIARVHFGGNELWKIFVNPTIKGTGKKMLWPENCMSLQGKKPKMKKRDKNVIITYFDPVDQIDKTEKYFGYDARIIQHEYDHLQGKLI